MSEDADIGIDVRSFLGEALTGAEPPHRSSADGSIARGDAARRRNRLLGGAGGVALTVAAAVGTMTVAHGGGGAPNGAAGGATGGVTAVATHVEPATGFDRMDNLYDLARNLPGVLNPLLPKGVSVSWDANAPGPATFLRDGGFQLAGPTGSNGVLIDTYRATASQPVHSVCAGPGENGCQTTPVPGGTVGVRNESGTPHKWGGCSDLYEFTPTDRSYDFIMSLQCQGSDVSVQLTPAQFVDLVQKPGFADVVHLADYLKPASAFGKQARDEMDAAIGRTMGPLLPAGYSQRLSTTDLQGMLDLVGPSGSVVAGANWRVGDPTGDFVEHCGASKSENGDCTETKVPGGTFFEGHMGATTYVFVPDGSAAKEFSAVFDGADKHPLTADQFLTVVKAPGAEQAITELNTLLSK